MIKRIQNKIAESRIALPVTAGYALLVWIAAGLISHGWWIQLACAVLATYLMVEMNNQNALIRIYSRMVSCSFLVLTCACNFLFHSMAAALEAVCLSAFLLLLFRTYQDKASPGGTFYAFLMVGLGSLVHVRILYLMPLFWLFMQFKIQSLSWRTFFASIIGVLFPYWFIAPYCLWRNDFTALLQHFEQLGWVTFPFDYRQLTVNEVLFFTLLIVLTTVGTVHYARTRYKDKIRTRMLFDCFSIMSWVAIVLFALQPQHATLLLPLLTACCSPLIAHFLALTHTRWTNMAFCLIVGAVLIITAVNLWIPSFHF